MKLLLTLLSLLALALPHPALAEGDSSSDDDGTTQASDEDKDKARKIQRPRLAPAPALAAGGIGAPPVDADKDDEDGDDGDDGSGGSSAAVPRPATGARPSGSTGSKAVSVDDDDEEPAREPHVAAGDRKVVTATPDEVMVHIDYDGAELKDIIKDFSEKTGYNFLVDPKISGKVTIISPRPVSSRNAYRIFQAALDSQGFTTVVEGRDRDGHPWLTRIIDSREAKSEPLEVYRGSTPDTARLITKILQLENVSVDDVSKVIQKMISGVGDLTVYNPSNTLILTDSGNNIRRLEDIIKELDIRAPKQRLEVVPVQFADATRVVEIIREIYGEEASGSKGAATSTVSNARARANRRNSKSKAAATPDAASSTSVGDATSHIGKMIADDRTNSIIVLATEKSLEEIKELIAKIDYETDPFAQSDIQVIYLAHAKAEELSATLNSLIQQSNQNANTNSRTPTSVRGNNRGVPGAASRDGAQGAVGGAPGDLGGNFNGEVRITHDVPTNSLVVTAATEDFRRLRKVVDALDIRRKQVFVETVIMEVSDSQINDAGVSWHGGRPGDPNNPAGVNVVAGRGTQSLNLASALLDGSLLGGLGLGIFGNAIDLSLPGVDGGIQIPMFGIVLRALQDDSSTNVLSAPNILTLDNEEASIEVGETVPFPTGGFLGGLAGAAGAAGGLSGLPSVSFTREDVGIILRITPQVNESDWVTLDIYQEISEVKEGSAANSLTSGGPTTTKRSADTHVSVRSNQTIVIGGLMQEVETEAESKVPILGDIPLIGALFRNKKKTKRKTNLLIFLTPHVIDGPEDLQEVYRIKMLQREEFMRRFYGKTRQEQLDELNALVRYSMNLPDTPSVYRDRVSRPRTVNLTGSDQEPMPGRVSEEVRSMLREEDDGAILITPDGEFEVRGDDGDGGDGGDDPVQDPPGDDGDGGPDEGPAPYPDDGGEGDE